ncbi:MAG: hypothetical protein E7456_00355 [Ruminococcaceae bacterium]|nr:hypothetical protein [Oscillospiraceae bacterium]
MGELEDKLNSILSSPEEMEKIMGIARSLSQSGFGEENKQKSKSRKDDIKASQSDIFSSLDPRMLSMMTRLMGGFNNSSNDKAKLIDTIKPYLRKERREKLEEAASLAKMAKLAKLAFSEFSGGDQDL